MFAKYAFRPFIIVILISVLSFAFTPLHLHAAPPKYQLIAAGESHTCAITDNSSVVCWGYNYEGQLGDGTQISRSSPANIINLAQPIAQLSSGGNHTCALTKTGTVFCWGSNRYGQLGDGSQERRTSPVQVGELNSVLALSSGSWHTCAVLADSVKCWGWNGAGLLGDGTQTDQLTPANVQGSLQGVQNIAAGATHTCILINSGVKCWGYNNYGQLGDGSTVLKTSPTDVIGLEVDVQSISAGDWHTCAIKKDETIWCWGYNLAYQLGDGTQVDRSTPVQVANLAGSFAQISAGGAHTCVRTTAGMAKCWGVNDSKQLGDNSFEPYTTIIDVSVLPKAILDISSGGKHTCAILLNGEYFCWGYNATGQLGNGIMNTASLYQVFLPFVSR